MKIKNCLHNLVQGLTVTSTMGILGFVIGACADHVKNKSFDTVIETGGIVGAGFAVAGVLISIGMFAVKSNTDTDELSDLESALSEAAPLNYGAAPGFSGLPVVKFNNPTLKK